MQISLLETDTQKQLPEQVKGKLSKTASDGWVSFSQKQWEEMKMDSVLACIGAWKVPKLLIGGLNNPKLIDHIAMVEMRSLKQIKLNQNQIESLEGLQNLDLPALETLEVGANHLTSLRVFRKTQTPSLSIIILANNSIKDHSVISQMCCPNLSRIFLASYTGEEQCSDPRGSAKFATHNLAYMSMWSSKRIKQDRFKQTLKRRYANLHVDF